MFHRQSPVKERIHQYIIVKVWMIGAIPNLNRTKQTFSGRENYNWSIWVHQEWDWAPWNKLWISTKRQTENINNKIKWTYHPITEECRTCRNVPQPRGWQALVDATNAVGSWYHPGSMEHITVHDWCSRLCPNNLDLHLGFKLQRIYYIGTIQVSFLTSAPLTRK